MDTESIDIQKILMHEMDTLRQELQHLKNCQVRYFLFSITVTGAVIGVLARAEPSAIGGLSIVDPIQKLGYLAPLLIVIPCWWIFYDKASSITRIVGYYRQLEKMILGQETYIYLGWERSLAKFRTWQETQQFNYQFEHSIPETMKVLKILSLDTAHRYWVINWYTFLVLSLVCIALSGYPWGWLNTSTASVFLLIVGFSAYRNLKSICELVFGRTSFYTIESCWDQILKAK